MLRQGLFQGPHLIHGISWLLEWGQAKAAVTTVSGVGLTGKSPGNCQSFTCAGQAESNHPKVLAPGQAVGSLCLRIPKWCSLSHKHFYNVFVEA